MEKRKFIPFTVKMGMGSWGFRATHNNKSQSNNNNNNTLAEMCFVDLRNGIYLF